MSTDAVYAAEMGDRAVFKERIFVQRVIVIVPFVIRICTGHEHGEAGKISDMFAPFSFCVFWRELILYTETSLFFAASACVPATM